MPQDQSITGEAHQHAAIEILACPPDSPLGRDAEVCSCGAQRLVDVPGKPAGQWADMNPIPYAIPIGNVCQAVGADCGFTVLDPRDLHLLQAGATVTMLRYSQETGSVAKVRGVITTEATLNRQGRQMGRFRITGFEDGGVSPLQPGDPVYLEPLETARP